MTISTFTYNLVALCEIDETESSILASSGACIVELGDLLPSTLNTLESEPHKIYPFIHESLQQNHHIINRPIMVLVDSGVSQKVRAFIKAQYNLVEVDEIYALANTAEIREYIDSLSDPIEHDFAQLAFELSCSTDSSVHTQNQCGWNWQLFSDVVKNQQFSYSYKGNEIHVLLVRTGVIEVNGKEMSLYKEDLVFELKHFCMFECSPYAFQQACLLSNGTN